jgi:hypothetical protein
MVDVPPYRRWRYPPGCPDPDWCSGNGVCYWRCNDNEDAIKPMKVIRAIGFANGFHCPHEGLFLKAADFEAFGGRGYMTFTDDIAKAMKFETAGDAMVMWRTQSKTRPIRPDGEPNRPLTALTIEIEDA